MKFEEVLPQIRQGAKARRPHWHKEAYIQIPADCKEIWLYQAIKPRSVLWNENSLLAEDWELVVEKAKDRVPEGRGFVAPVHDEPPAQSQAPRNVTWDVCYNTFGTPSSSLLDRLQDGWEPFAVDDGKVYMRKEVK